MKKHHKSLLALTLALAPIGHSVQAQENVIRIGATIMMVRPDSDKIGKVLGDEFELINSTGGINGRKIVFTIMNDECKADRGVQNINRFVNELKAHLVITNCSPVSLPTIDITARAKVPQITGTSSSDLLTKKGSEWFFRPSISERFYKTVIGKHVGEKVGKKVAYLVSTDAAAQSFANNMIDSMKRLYGVDPVFKAQVTVDDVDYRSFLLKIKASNPDAIAFGGTDSELAKMVTQAAEVGISQSLPKVANAYACTSSFAELAGSHAVGVIHSCPFSPLDQRQEIQDFVKLVSQRYGLTRPDLDVAQTYDMAQIIKRALTSAKLTLTEQSLASDREAIRDAFASIKDYRGLAAGPISFCAAPTPQCRDGGKTPTVLQYTKGGKDFEVKVLEAVTLEPDHGL